MNELSEELKKELGIETQDDYDLYLNNNIKSNKELKNNKHTSFKKKPEISNTKKKSLMRKAQTLAEKKIIKQNRENVINQLSKYSNNKDIDSILNKVNSIRDLGKKEKIPKELNYNVKNTDSNSNQTISDISNDSMQSIKSNDNKSNDLNLEDVEYDKKESIYGFNINKDIHEILKQKILSTYKEKSDEILKEAAQEALGSNIFKPDSSSRIIVDRKHNMQKQREKLPIINNEQEIIDTINNSLITIISGETGSGKSTQIPQFLYEYGYSSMGMIGITQPRRVATYSLSKRVAEELNYIEGKEVGYQVKNDNKTDKNITKIKFMTEGILLKEFESDYFLSKYSVIIIDEAHERTLNCDLLIGMIVRVIKLRNILHKHNIKIKNNSVPIVPLRLIIMSATIAVEEFQHNDVFKDICKPKVYKLESRQFEVKVFQSKVTTKDYFNESLKTVVKIHSKLPEGGILLFLTGKKEINNMCIKLNEVFKKTKISKNLNTINNNTNPKDNKNDDDNIIDSTYTSVNKNNIIEDINKDVLLDKEDNLPCSNDYSNESNILNESDELLSDINSILDNSYNEDIDIDSEEIDNRNTINKNINNDNCLYDTNQKSLLDNAIILPLYSSLPLSEQQKVFYDYSTSEFKHKRLIVISTNIAETSITIPNIKYVIDTGREKTKKFMLSYSKFEIQFISQASANQRRGRAGRTGPGICYRLYSNGLLGKMSLYNEPQISISPLDQVLLYLKSLNINNINNFPFITVPDKAKVIKAFEHLLNIQAIDVNYTCDKYNLNKDDYLLDIISNKQDINNTQYKDEYIISSLGKKLIQFPLQPRISKVLLVTNKLGLYLYGLTIAGILSASDNIFNNNSFNNEKIELTNNSKTINNVNLKSRLDNIFIVPTSDILTMGNVIIKVLTSLEITSDINMYNKRITYSKSNKNTLNIIENLNLNKKVVFEIVDLILLLLKDTERLLECNNKQVKYIDSYYLNNKTINNSANKKNLLFMLLKLSYYPIELHSILLQAIFSGFVDSIAKKTTVNSKIVYESSENSNVCNIHVSSVLVKDRPQYIFYKDILKPDNEDKYLMIGNNYLNKEWIFNICGSNLVYYSHKNIISDPIYNKAEDKIKSYIDFKYGKKNWYINNVLVDMESKDDTDDLVYCWFGKFLLDGEIFDFFKPYVKHLNSKTNILTNKLNLSNKVVNLIGALKVNNVVNKQSLLSVLSKNSSFLINTIVEWYDNNTVKFNIRQNWNKQLKQMM